MWRRLLCRRTIGRVLEPESQHRPADDADRVMEATLACGRELGVVAAATARDFTILLRGGQDLCRRTGLQYDEIRGQ